MPEARADAPSRDRPRRAPRRPLRVLSVIHLYPPHHLGGYEVACQGAMERFADRGIDVEVLTADHRMDGVDDPGSGVPIRRVLRGWWDWDAWAPARPSLAHRVRTEAHNQRALRHALDEFRPDVVSIWDLGMMSWALATIVEERDIPVVLTFLDDWVVFAHTFDAWTRMFDRRPWARPMGSWLGLETRLPSFSGATASVASEMIRRAIDGSRWTFPEADLVPIGVDTRHFPIGEPEVQSWDWRLLYVGRVVAEKGVATLVRALAELPATARLDVVGHAHDSERAKLEALAGELGVADRLSFALASSRADLRQRYRGADVLVFPSEWPEPFGIVPLEAMACGIPVVATGTGGSGEYLRDGDNCVLFRPGDAGDLAQAVTRLAGDEVLRRRITDGGTQTAHRLNMDRFTDGLELLHRRAAGDRAASASGR